MNPISFEKWFPELNLKHPLLIAGPCSAETEEQVLKTAHAIAKNKEVKVYRAGIWKPRTRPGSFEGVGEVALPWLKKVKEETGLLTTCEVATAAHVEAALKYDVDIFWVGARTTANPFSVDEIAQALKGTGKPVMVKNPVNADLSLWIGALERISRVGVNKLAAIHRGFSLYDKTKYRNNPVWKIPIELKRRFPNLPIICDPSHIAGSRDLIYPVSQKALDINFAGLMIETHIDPSCALSDSFQQVTPETLSIIIERLKLRTPKTDNKEFETNLEELRAKIDRLDEELMEVLSHRMEVVEQIGKEKMKNNITALQVSRFDQMMEKIVNVLAPKTKLRSEFAREIFQVIHDESVRKQTEMMREN